MWISLFSGDRTDALLYDFENKRAVGKVMNGWPLMLMPGASQLLSLYPPNPPGRFTGRIPKFLDRLYRDLFRFRREADGPVSFWMLDLNRGTSGRIGTLPRCPGAQYFISPDSHFYACALGPHPSRLPDVCVLDLVQRTLTIWVVPGPPTGWWDNSRLLCCTSDRDIFLQEAATGKAMPLIRAASLAEFLCQNNLADDLSEVRAFCEWNGRENDFYLTGLRRESPAGESPLIKLERPDGALRLVAGDFKFETGGHFDSTGRFYLYPGSLPGDSDAVYLRDLKTGTIRNLAPGTSNVCSSLPRFYRDSVVYSRTNTIWRINLDGSHNSRLFPP